MPSIRDRIKRSTCFPLGVQWEIYETLSRTSESTRCREHRAIKILYPVISSGPVFPSFSIPAFQSLFSRFVDVLSVLARITVFRLAGSY